jgi:hypothetical protein
VEAAAEVAGFSGEVLASACTGPDDVAFTPPGTAGWPVVSFGSPSGDGEEGDLISSGITATAQTSGVQGFGENVNFYQLGDSVSTKFEKKNKKTLPIQTTQHARHPRACAW